MTAACTLNGARCFEARSTIPAWGASWHDIVTDSETVIKGAATLQIADLTIKGTILSGGVGQGRAFYRLVSGAGGWGKPVAKRAYVNDAGMRALTVLDDVAQAVGETIDATTVPADLRLGPGWVRPADLACRTLELVSPSAWFVGEDGVTRLGARPATTYNLKLAQTSHLDLARGTVTIAADSIAKLLPGTSVAGLVALDVEHEFDVKGGLRTKVWGRQGAAASRRLSAFRALVDQFDPGRKFRGLSQYRIVTQSGNRLNLQPVRTSLGMPDLTHVRVRPGIPGALATHALGSRVLVAFADSDPSGAVVVAFEDADSPGFVATTLGLAGGGAAVARVGDSVTITADEIVALGLVAPAGTAGGPITAPAPSQTMAKISSGSSKVTSG